MPPDNDVDDSNQSPEAIEADHDEPNLSKNDLLTHNQLSRALHSLDLLNSQLGVAGALLVSLYHLQKQRESVMAQQPMYQPVQGTQQIGYGQAGYPPQTQAPQPGYGQSQYGASPTGYSPPPSQPGYNTPQAPPQSAQGSTSQNRPQTLPQDNPGSGN